MDLNKFIAEHITGRDVSMFAADIESNSITLLREIEGKSVCVIGGAGSIGSSFIKALLPFRPGKLIVVDINENGLAELVRDIRSTYGLFCPEEFRTYAINFADPIFEKIFLDEKGFDIVANFSAHKHVRSEKDKYAVQALIENNDIKAKKLMDLLTVYPPRHFFCVSTDKAANPVNIMGASKKIMEDLVMAYNKYFKVTTARFANVAFSNGSLPDSWRQRMDKLQPLAAPTDVKRYFVSPEESGQICLLACILGNGAEIFFPKLNERQMLTFSSICDSFIEEKGYMKHECVDDKEAKRYASEMSEESSTYPVFYSGSDTTGEKPYEEFYIDGEKVNLDRFKALGVIEDYQVRPIDEIEQLFNRLTALFSEPDMRKEDIVEAIRDFLPTFQHQETGKNLDSKM